MTAPFYVGYHARMPAALKAWMRPRVAALVALAVALSVVIALAQAPFAPGVFEYGTKRTFDGWIETYPAPALVVQRPGVTDGAGETSRWLLVDQGKWSALPRVAPYSGQRVRASGTLVYRAGTTMLELAGDPTRHPEPAPPPAVTDTDLGVVTLKGEIVDSKCWLGVMKPADRKIHRACAVRCISGGVPPLFVVSADSTSLQFVLVGPGGEAVNDAVLDRIAEPLEITGRAVRRGGMLFLYADPATFSRSS